MAEGGMTEQVLSDTHTESEECPICYTEYKDPRLLDCSHRFCLKCLQELKHTQAKDGENIVCPLCRRETILSDDRVDVDMLPRCSQGEVEIASHEKLLNSDRSKVICQACDEGNEAISRCMDCEHYHCHECQKAHQRFAALKRHRIATLTELDSDGRLKDSVPKCQKHPDQDICLYCNSCDALICNTCTTFEHKKSVHFYSSIEQAFSKCKHEINEAMSQTKQSIQDFISANPVSTDHSRHRLAAMLTRTKIQISQKAEKEIAKIRQKEHQLRQEAQDVFSGRDKQFAFATAAEETLIKANKVMMTASCYEILESKLQLVQDLREQVAVQKSLDISHKKSFLGFEESQNAGELGTLLLQQSWEFKHNQTICQKGEYLAVYEYSTSEVVVADSQKLVTLSPDGKELSRKAYSRKPQKDTPQKDTPQELNAIYNPTALEINKDDQLIILDCPAVKMFNKEYKLLHQFTPSQEPRCVPTCLAVDDSNLIAVGYEDRSKIAIHNPDGSLVRTIGASGINKHLTISKQRFIYASYTCIAAICFGFCDFCSYKLKGIDFNGNEVFTVSLDGPCQAVCEKAGDIYVAVANEIRHYSADGKYIDSLNAPSDKHFTGSITDMKFTSDGILLVLRS